MAENISFCEHLRAKKGELTVREAGRCGGLSVLKKYGKAHYIEIGKLGQKSTRAKYTGWASVWGKMGGRPRKPTLREITGEQGR